MSSFKSNIDLTDYIPFCVFPNSFIRNGKLSSNVKVLFEILCSYDHLDGDGKRKGWCSPALDTVAEQMGLEKRSVQNHLKKLVELGMVTIIYRNTQATSNEPRTSIYVLNILPGLSEVDLKRIAHTRNIEIKHIISGLNTIKVQTTNGIQTINREEFDLQYLVTGEHSSDVIDGELDENTDTEKDTKQTTDDDNIEFEFKPYTPKAKRKEAKCDDPDPIVRILKGDYSNLKPIDLCKYFKHCYELQYPGQIYMIDRYKDPSTLQAKFAELENLPELIEFFVRRYKDMFYSKDYPKPQIYQLSIAWIMNKLIDSFNRAEQAKQDAEPIRVQNSEEESTMFF